MKSNIILLSLIILVTTVFLSRCGVDIFDDPVKQEDEVASRLVNPDCSQLMDLISSTSNFRITYSIAGSSNEFKMKDLPVVGDRTETPQIDGTFIIIRNNGVVTTRIENYTVKGDGGFTVTEQSGSASITTNGLNVFIHTTYDVVTPEQSQNATTVRSFRYSMEMNFVSNNSGSNFSFDTPAPLTGEMILDPLIGSNMNIDYEMTVHLSLSKTDCSLDINGQQNTTPQEDATPTASPTVVTTPVPVPTPSDTASATPTSNQTAAARPTPNDPNAKCGGYATIWSRHCDSGNTGYWYTCTVYSDGHVDWSAREGCCITVCN